MISELEELLETTSEAEKVAFLIIGHTGEIKSTRLQKLSLMVKALLEGKVPTSHGAYLFGGYSDDIDEGVENMRSEGYLSYESGKGFSLTEDGKELFIFLSKNEPKLNDTIEKITKMFNGLSDKQVTAITYKLFPSLTENSIIKEEMKRIGKNINIETFRLSKTQ